MSIKKRTKVVIGVFAAVALLFFNVAIVITPAKAGGIEGKLCYQSVVEEGGIPARVCWIPNCGTSTSAGGNTSKCQNNVE